VMMTVLWSRKERFIFDSRWPMFTINSMPTLPLKLLVLDPSLIEEPMVDCVDLKS
jgi:hypothetical protein